MARNSKIVPNADLFPNRLCGFVLEKPLSTAAQHNFAMYVREGETTKITFEAGFTEAYSRNTAIATAADLRAGKRQLRALKTVDWTIQPGHVIAVEK